MKCGLFNGVGIYINEQNVASFHFDTRPETIRDDEPDRWGGVITHPYSTDVGDHVRQTEYVAADVVLGIIKKNAGVSIIFLIGSGLILWLIFRRS